MSDNKYDVIIIGGGAAGMTAAIYTSRKGLRTAIISQDLGGQMSMTNEIENYPGVELTSGPDLVNRFRAQAEKFGAEIFLNQVTDVAAIDSGFKVSTSTAEYVALAVILAFGLTPRSLGVPGEDKFKGRGVSFCATCDAPFYKNKVVAVVGGGNSALEAVEELSGVATKVYLIHRNDSFRAEQILIDRLKTLPNVEVLMQSAIEEFEGETKLKSVVVRDLTGTKTDFELTVDGVFLEIGYITKTDWLKNLVDLNERGEIAINAKAETSRAGLFAAGDVTTLLYKQIVISAGEGAKAALSAAQYIAKTTGRIAPPDWGKRK